MLRGNAPATIDEKGRLKVPAAFRRPLEERYGTLFFITSVDGQAVRVYPLSIWEKLEARIASRPSFNRSVSRLSDLISYFGAETQMDRQGRLLISPHLRRSAGMDGEVAVLGKHDRLEVWNNERFLQRLEANPLTEEDLRELAELGL
ncbi:MAG: division/cell wall cluster transcriptional repressor MraZ [Acidobacteriota bacterium]